MAGCLLLGMTGSCLLLLGAMGRLLLGMSSCLLLLGTMGRLLLGTGSCLLLFGTDRRYASASSVQKIIDEEIPIASVYRMRRAI